MILFAVAFAGPKFKKIIVFCSPFCMKRKYQFGKENWLSTGQPAGRQGQQTLSSLTGVILKFRYLRVGFFLIEFR